MQRHQSFRRHFGSRSGSADPLCEPAVRAPANPTQRRHPPLFASMASSSSPGRRVAGVAIVFVFHIGPKRGMQQTCWLDITEPLERLMCVMLEFGQVEMSTTRFLYGGGSDPMHGVMVMSTDTCESLELFTDDVIDVVKLDLGPARLRNILRNVPLLGAISSSDTPPMPSPARSSLVIPSLVPNSSLVSMAPVAKNSLVTLALVAKSSSIRGGPEPERKESEPSPPQHEPN